MALTGIFLLSFIPVALQFISELDDIGFSLAKINGMCSLCRLVFPLHPSWTFDNICIKPSPHSPREKIATCLYSKALPDRV